MAHAGEICAQGIGDGEHIKKLGAACERGDEIIVKIIIYVGELVGDHPDAAAGADVGAYFVGEGPEESGMQERVHRIILVYFRGCVD